MSITIKFELNSNLKFKFRNRI